MKQTSEILNSLNSVFGIKVRKPKEPEHLTLGVPAIDEMFGDCLRPGTIVEIYGPASSGKTALLVKIMEAYNSKVDIGTDPPRAVFFDGDYSAHEEMFKNDPDPNVQRCNSIEALQETVCLYIEHGVRLVLIDSINSIPSVGSTFDVGKDTWSKDLTRVVRKIAKTAATFGAYVIITSQIRNTESGAKVSASGMGVKRESSFRILLERLSTIKRVGSHGFVTRAYALPDRSNSIVKSVDIEVLFERRAHETRT